MASQSQLTSQGLPQQIQVNKDLLVGSAGQEFISNELNSNPNIENSINVIKAKGALPDPRVKPLLEFLDNLQLSRAESFHGVLEGAKQQLFKFMEHVPPEALLDLLEVSFPYIGLRDLKDVPLAILHKINPVPANYLRQIAADNDLFQELPIDVQRQVAIYISDQATLIRAMDMDQFLSLAPAAGGSSGAHPSENVLLGHQVPRKQLRKFNPALRKLVEMVGSSLRIYKGITQLLRARLKDAQGLVMGMQEAALCALRSQLIMALHDHTSDPTSAAHFNCEQDPWYKMAWTLEACINDKGLAADDKRLHSLKSYFTAYDKPPAGAVAPSRKKQRVGSLGDAESQGVPSRDSSPALGDAAMCLRDPSALYLLVHQVLRRLHAVIKAEGQPSRDDHLVFLTRLIQLACSARTQLRDNRYSFAPASNEMMSVVYPCLIDCLIDAEDRPDSSAVLPEGEVDGQQIRELVTLLTKEEVVRKVTQGLALERLGLSDLATAQVLLTALQQALDKTSDKALAEWTPFAGTLAQRMVRLVKGGRVAAGSPLWVLIVDRLLLRLIDTDVQVQEELLYCLQQVADTRGLSTAQLAHYLQSMLRSTKRSRRRAMARHQDRTKALQQYSASGMGYTSEGGYTSAGGYASGTYGGYSTSGMLSDGYGLKAANKGSDSVKHLYRTFPAKHPQLTPATAPDLFEYLGADADTT